MEKYNKELIINYIKGNHIEDYDLNELENDKVFMKKVIDISNDEKMYSFCSNNLKKDYEFIKYIILKFKNNINFITSVADYFLDNTDTDYERIELSIIMNELTNQEKEMNKYNTLCDAIYSNERLQIELYKLRSNDEELKNKIGMGFLLIYDIYNHSNIILNYYAKRIIEDIFTEYDIELEKILHNKFKTIYEINELGLNNYMLSFIENYDSMLASYASTHLDVLFSFRKKIIQLQQNWDKYSDECEKKKYNYMFEKVHEYMEEADSIFTEGYLICYIGRKLGILEKIKKYDYASEEMIEYTIEELSSEFVEQTFKVSFVERLHYKNVEDIIINTLFSDDVDMSNTKDSKNNKCKILKLKFNNNEN